MVLLGARKRLDAVLPTTVPLVEMLADLVEMCGEINADGGPAEWVVTRLGGRVLDPERTLLELEVVDGEMLYLRDTSQAVAPPAVEDFLERVVAIVAERGVWSVADLRALLLGASAAWLAGLAILLVVGAPFGRFQSALTVIAIAVILAAGGALLHRTLGQRLVSSLWAAFSVSLLSVGGSQLAWASQAGVQLSLAAGLAGLAVGAVAARLAAASTYGPAAGTALAAAPWAAATVIVASVAGSLQQAAVILALAYLVLVWLLPAGVARLVGLTALEEQRHGVPPDVQERVERGRVLLAWSLAGAGVGLVAALAVLGSTHDVFARASAVFIVVAVALHSRHYRRTPEVLALAVTSLAGLAVLETGLITDAAAGAVQATWAVPAVTAAALLFLGLFVRLPASPPHARRRVRHLELLAHIAIVPLALGALGVYSIAAEVGRRLG